MDRRYVALSIVSSEVRGTPVPLEAAVLVLDSGMRPLGEYATPVTPSERYDLPMVTMHMPSHHSDALEDEGLWMALQVGASSPDAADRMMTAQVEKHCTHAPFEVVILCDRLDATRDAVARFFPVLARKLDRMEASWLEVEPLRSFVETNGVYGRVEWKHRAQARAKAVAQYALQMRRTLSAGAAQLNKAAQVLAP